VASRTRRVSVRQAKHHRDGEREHQAIANAANAMATVARRSDAETAIMRKLT
jgi:hypothetical protein